MESKIKEMFPEWCNDDNKDYELMISDDLDSLISCALLNNIKGYKINYFYDFESIYELNKSTTPAIAIDCDLIKGRCWSNHVTKLSKDDVVNKQSANLNNILNISRNNYYKKFCGSTALQIWSYYDIPLPQSEKGKMALLAIDGGYLGHYDNRFIEVHSRYLNMMGFDELIEVLKRHTKYEFYDIEQKYKMKRKIKLNKDNKLETNLDLAGLQGLFYLDLSLPGGEFYIRKELSRDWPTNLIANKTYTKDDFTDIFSIALIYRNKVAFTKK
ncbi:MAG: hypothetical protein PHO63_06115 [Bacilli bacterium]|nr:hypothetical protein [Bacilli bacterium]